MMGSSKGEAGGGEVGLLPKKSLTGEVVRLRKGLFEARLSVRPGPAEPCPAFCFRQYQGTWALSDRCRACE